MIDPGAEGGEGPAVASADANLEGKVFLPWMGLGEKGQGFLVGETNGAGSCEEADNEAAQHVGRKIVEVNATCRKRLGEKMEAVVRRGECWRKPEGKLKMVL